MTQFSQKIQLRPYQLEAITQINASQMEGVTRQLVALPTGAGKTICFADLARQRNQKTLVLAHRDELIQQAVEKIKFVWPEVSIGIIQAGKFDDSQKVTVASVQTLARENSLQLLSLDFELVITDEAHHAPADSYCRIYQRLGLLDPIHVEADQYSPSDILHVGFTATPFRNKAKHDQLSTVFDDIVYFRSIVDMISEGYLVDINCKKVGVEMDLSALGKVGTDFNQGHLENALNNQNTNQIILNKWRDLAQDRKTLAFTSTVKHAHDLANLFREDGLLADAVDGKMSLRDRRRKVRAYQKGQTQILFNCGVLTEGFDDPRTDCVLLARPTTSRNLFMQMVGRGTRIHPDKDDLLLLDLACISDRHNIIGFPDLLDVSTVEDREEEIELDPIEEEMSLLRMAEEQSVSRINQNLLKTKDADLFGRKKTGRNRPADFAWMGNGVGGWTLDLFSYGTIIVSYLGDDFQEDQAYNLLLKQPEKRVITLASGLSQSHAFGLAESEVTKQFGSSSSMFRQNANWRRGKPSQKQIALLQSFQIDTSQIKTRGQASDLIGYHINNKNKRR